MECCIAGCERPGTVRAPYPHADSYCALHGVCPRCGGSVAAFEQYDGRWYCSCMIVLLQEDVAEVATPPEQEERKVIAFRPRPAAFDYLKQPDWTKHGFVKDEQGNWRERKRYEKEKKEAELAARGIVYKPVREPIASYTPDPGHVTYTKDDLDRMGISMMDLMRQLDAENARKRTRDLSPLI